MQLTSTGTSYITNGALGNVLKELESQVSEDDEEATVWSYDENEIGRISCSTFRRYTYGMQMNRTG